MLAPTPTALSRAPPTRWTLIILVVPYTTNDLLPYIRQAAAVISEESGTNGHAATVGLTLGKAVIVGAAGAVQRLKDGAMVSVDCARGVVQTLPQ